MNRSRVGTDKIVLVKFIARVITELQNCANAQVQYALKVILCADKAKCNNARNLEFKIIMCRGKIMNALDAKRKECISLMNVPKISAITVEVTVI